MIAVTGVVAGVSRVLRPSQLPEVGPPLIRRKTRRVADNRCFVIVIAVIVGIRDLATQAAIVVRINSQSVLVAIYRSLVQEIRSD